MNNDQAADFHMTSVAQSNILLVPLHIAALFPLKSFLLTSLSFALFCTDVRALLSSQWLSLTAKLQIYILAFLRFCYILKYVIFCQILTGVCFIITATIEMKRPRGK